MTHKSLKAWKQAHFVANASIDCARDHWRPHLKAVFDQLTRASLSVQVNIAEGFGFGYGSPRRFVNHLRIARGSALEAGDLLELLVERNDIPPGVGQAAMESCLACQRMLMGLIKKYELQITER